MGYNEELSQWTQSTRKGRKIILILCAPLRNHRDPFAILPIQKKNLKILCRKTPSNNT